MSARPSDVRVLGDTSMEDAVGVVEHLRARGVIECTPATVEALSGGVSNDVLAVESGGVSVVVKRALARLRVAEEWLADPDRVLTEAAALKVAARLQHDVVPPVLDVDEAARIIVIGRAPEPCREWRHDLLEGQVDHRVAERLGTILAAWQADSAGAGTIRAEFGSTDAFRQLRVDPFYSWVGRRHPDLATTIDGVARQMAETRSCFVHGDFSPKNVLLGPDLTWIIDWEVAHYGDPSFDVAFLVTHLLCKALHRPDLTADYRGAAGAFLAAYEHGLTATDLTPDPDHLAAQTACLLLARIDGKSPAPYLDDAARALGREVARAALAEGDPHIDDIWRRLA